MAQVPYTRRQRRQNAGLRTQLMYALTETNLSQQAYVFQWAMKNLAPSELSKYYSYMQRYRHTYHIKIQALVDQVGALLHRYEMAERHAHPPTGAGGCGCGCGGSCGSSGMSGGCGCGSSGMGDGMGFGFGDMIGDMATKQANQQASSSNTFNPQDPRHWMTLMNSGTDVVKKVACMADPNLAFCKGQAPTPTSLAELCKQSPTNAMCRTYNANPTAYQPVQATPKNNNTALYLAGGVGAAALFMLATQKR